MTGYLVLAVLAVGLLIGWAAVCAHVVRRLPRR